MTLLERLSQELKAAMLSKDTERLATLRLLKSAIGYAQIERKTDTLPDAEVFAIIQKEVKKRREAIEQYEKGGRPELASKEKQEILVLESFLPRPLSAEALEQLVRAAIQETGATGKKQMGQVIKAVQAKAAGRAEGKVISELVGNFCPDLCAGDVGETSGEAPRPLAGRDSILKLMLREDLVEEQIDHHAGHGDIHPERPGPARDFLMEIEALFHRPAQRHQHQGNNHDGQHRVRQKNRQIDRPKPFRLLKARDRPDSEVIREITNQKNRGSYERRHHAVAVCDFVAASNQ